MREADCCDTLATIEGMVQTPVFQEDVAKTVYGIFTKKPFRTFAYLDGV